MAKFTSLLLIATAAALATISSAAPINTTPAVTAASEETSVFASSVKYTGKATWFTDSYGSCNEKWDGNTEPIVALNAHQMGAQSWGNPACGHKLIITNTANKKSVVARVVDKCPGDQCAWGSLDLSPAAFTKLGSLDTGILNIEWNYI